jgi:protein-L-isoaspartate(D-aspartate) O-methyltransferase
MNMPEEIDFERQLEQLIEQIRSKGVRDKRVLNAIRCVPRHRLVTPEYQPYAYVDHALPIGEGQTISQPSLVAYMTELLRLKGHERVLEIGTGSGYQAAVLSMLCQELVTIERNPRLTLHAFHALQELHIHHVTYVMGDGTTGFPPLAPYDCILVTAGSPGNVPPPLLEQLSPDHGRLLLPLGSREHQSLTMITKRGDTTFQRTYGECVFVPLIGKYGWQFDEKMV